MYRALIQVVIGLLCLLPTLAGAVATTQSIHVEWGYTPPSEPAVTGFKLYQEGAFACQTQDPAATAMDCEVTLSAETTNFTLTATFSDGTESPHSAAYAFTLATPEPTALTAVITPSTLNGEVPFVVIFDASASTGAIASYQWDFGDGAVAAGMIASHSYSATGTYTVKLTVADAAGQTGTTTVNVNVSAAPVPATPPTAVIASTTAAGEAPLGVAFDGSDSTATAGATITIHSWSFGDGAIATGANASHSFTAAGNYTTILTVTDSNGLTASASTPVVVTAPIIVNKAPTAVATATPPTGTAPLVVTFDASGSTDSDGAIASYVWSFGDGSTATGKTVTHTYTKAAVYSATLEVTDDRGATDATSSTITVNNAPSLADFNMELGEISISSNWVRVPFTTPFTNPIVVVGPPSSNDTAPCTVRLRNVNATGFDIRLTEWNYLDGSHPAETVSYVVMEKGRITLPDGSNVEAGSFSGATTSQTIKFSKVFSKTPVVMTTVASFKDADTISGRLKKITRSSFVYAFREQEKNMNVHAREIVHYIAWESGKGTVGTIQYEIANTSVGVTSDWMDLAFQRAFQQPPLFLADIQTTNDSNTAALRTKTITANGVKIMVEEEQSKDLETNHLAEIVGYFALEKVEN